MTLWLSLGGCVQSVFFPPDLWTWDDSGWWETGRPRNRGDDDDTTEGGPLQVQEVNAGANNGCDLDMTSWVIEIRTNGWIHQARLNLVRTMDGAAEEHPFTSVGSDPGGAWDYLRVGPLTPGVPAAEQVAGQSSQFTCAEDSARLTGIARIWDGSMTLLDCAVWGADPAGGVAHVRGIDPDVNGLGGCRTVQADSTP